MIATDFTDRIIKNNPCNLWLHFIIQSNNLNLIKFFLFSLLVVLTIQRTSAQNLIPNPGFEDINICTEFTAPCAPSAWMTTSPYAPEYYGSNNNKYSIVVVYHGQGHEVRVYLQTMLLCPLVNGGKYLFSLKVFPLVAAVNEIGVLFTDSCIFMEKSSLINANPSIEFRNDEKLLMTDRNKYPLKLESVYVANGKEKFIIIGNYLKDNEIKLKKLYKDSTYNQIYRYIVDDISLTSMDSVEICSDYEGTKEYLYSIHERHPITHDNIFGPYFTPKKTEFSKETPKNEVIKRDTIIFSDLLFEFDSYKINDNFHDKIDSIISQVNKYSIEKIFIYGHTDSIGDDNYNYDLSLHRAQSVSDLLVQSGIDGNLIESYGFGSSKPIADNRTVEGRRKNRRVEIIINYTSIK